VQAVRTRLPTPKLAGFPQPPTNLLGIVKLRYNSVDELFRLRDGTMDNALDRPLVRARSVRCNLAELLGDPREEPVFDVHMEHDGI
jgi:hypothetical protein